MDISQRMLLPEDGDGEANIARDTIYRMRCADAEAATFALPSELSGECKMGILTYDPDLSVQTGEWLGRTPIAMKRCHHITLRDHHDSFLDVSISPAPLFSLVIDFPLQRFNAVIDEFRRFNHPHVLKLYGWCQGVDHENKVYLVSPWLDNRSVDKYLQERPHLSPHERLVLVNHPLHRWCRAHRRFHRLSRYFLAFNIYKSKGSTTELSAPITF